MYLALTSFFVWSNWNAFPPLLICEEWGDGLAMATGES